jgi:hypothetical protein
LPICNPRLWTNLLHRPQAPDGGAGREEGSSLNQVPRTNRGRSARAAPVANSKICLGPMRRRPFRVEQCAALGTEQARGRCGGRGGTAGTDLEKQWWEHRHSLLAVETAELGVRLDEPPQLAARRSERCELLARHADLPPTVAWEPGQTQRVPCLWHRLNTHEGTHHATTIALQPHLDATP